MDASELELLRATVSSALAAAAPGEADDVLDRLGWREMLDTETSVAVAVVFETLGTTGRTATALDDVLVLALGREPRRDLAVLLPPFGEWSPRTDGAMISGCATARIDGAREVLVPIEGGAVSMTVRAVASTAVHGLDPELGLRRVDVDTTADRAASTEPASWPTALALGRRALAHQIAGACRAMLDLACAHAVDRVQFGRPIARFQAVRHRLADALVAVESIDACLDAAAEVPAPDTAAAAKAVAGRSAREVGRHCQQVLAGVGFTTDHPFHRFLKRAMVLDGILGPADSIVVDLGRELLATRHVPVLVEL